MKFSRKFIASLSQFYTNVSNCRDSPPRGRVRGRGHAQLVYSPETPTTESTIPIIDLSLLSSGSSSSSLNRRSQLLQDLDKACCQWGLFLVINHGVPEKQRNAMVKACLQISDPLEKERTAFVAAGNVENEPRPKNKACFINAAAPRERILFNKDYTQILTRVNFFEPPTKLPLSSFGEVSVDYCKSIKRLATALVRLISETECVQDGWYKKMLKKEPGNGGYHVLEANLYPPGEAESSETTTQFAVERPDQDQCHSSMGLLTVLMQNDVGGLEVLHNDKWVRVIQVPNSFVVIVGDHLEMASNGRFKRKPYRAAMVGGAGRRRRRRISVSVDHGRNTFVSVDKRWMTKSRAQQTARLNVETLCNFMKSDQFQGQCGFDLVRRGVGKLTHTIRLICFKCGVHLWGKYSTD